MDEGLRGGRAEEGRGTLTVCEGVKCQGCTLVYSICTLVYFIA